MTGFDYKEVVGHFNASDSLKQKTFIAAHKPNHKLLKTKRDKIVNYSIVAAVLAVDIMLFCLFDVGSAISLTSKSLRGPSSSSLSPQLSTEVSSEKSTQNSTDKAMENTTGAYETNSAKETVKATESPTQNQATKAQETTVPVKANSNTTSKYSNLWSTMNPISMATYNFTGGGSVDVKTLTSSATGNLVEAKVGPNEMCSFRMEVYPALFNNGLVVTKTGDGIVTFTNDNEGIILRENIVSYVKETSESQSDYVTRCINYLSQSCSNAENAKQAFSLSNYYVCGVNSFSVMTNTDTEWRGVMKVTYTGDPIAAMSNQGYGFGYLTVVFDKSTQCFLVQTYVAQMSVTNKILSQMSYACYDVKYKVN